MKNNNIFIHKTAIIEKKVKIGGGTKIWDNVHIREGAEIGENCIIGEKTYIAYDVKIGHLVKINAFVYICAKVTIEDMVMVSAGTVFTNDKLPRAMTPDLSRLQTSLPTNETLATFVRKGATLGANVTVGCGIEIGEFAMVGMGSVVTKNVLPFHLTYGNPAKPYGYVCRCGAILDKSPISVKKEIKLTCQRCRRNYSQSGCILRELISS